MSFQSAIVEQSYMTWLHDRTWENWSNFCNIQQWVQRWTDERAVREQVAHEQALAREQALAHERTLAHEQAIREYAMQSRLPPRSPPRSPVKSLPVLPLMLRPCLRPRSHLGNGVSFGTPSIW